MRHVLFPGAFVLALSVTSVAAAETQVPTLNVEPSCRAAADTNSPIRRDFDGCMQSERRSRADIDKEWPQFAAAAKTHCVALSTTGGVPSYTELLTCLEMEREAAQLRSGEAPTTTGSGTGSIELPAHRQPRRF